jgi:hypothetical protein
MLEVGRVTRNGSQQGAWRSNSLRKKQPAHFQVGDNLVSPSSPSPIFPPTEWAHGLAAVLRGVDDEAQAAILGGNLGGAVQVEFVKSKI